MPSAIAYNFATSFFAGPSQTIANQQIETMGKQLVPGWYTVIAGVIGLVRILCMRMIAQATPREIGRASCRERVF